MSPQCEDGYTKIANELLEALCAVRIPGEPMQIFLVILRKTYGFGKKSDQIALSQFVEATGIIRTHVQRAIDKLEVMNLIVTKEGNKRGSTYEINKHYKQWKLLPKKVTVTKEGKKVTKEGTKCYPKRGIQKKERNYTKETGMFEICIAWKAFVEMRKKIKKEMTPYAERLKISCLLKLQEAGHDPVAVLNQSIGNNWQDLYPIKPTETDTPIKQPAPDTARLEKFRQAAEE